MERDKRFVQTGVNSAGDRVYSRTRGREQTGDTATADLDELKKAELQALAEERGLAKSGTKDELIERLEG